MKKKILIIGKNSFIGKNLFIYLKKFFNLYIINFKQFKKIPKKKLAHYNFIINCSITKKYVSSSYSVKNDNDVYIANKIKNIPYLKTIFLSTRKIYKVGNNLKENSPTKPKCNYSKNKQITEKKLIQIHSDKVLILRISNIVGQFNKNKSTRKVHYTFIDNFFLNIKKNIIFNNKNLYKDFISIKKFCEIVRKLVLKDANGIFNVSLGKKVYLKDIVSWLNFYNKNHNLVKEIPNNFNKDCFYLNNLKLKKKIFINFTDSELKNYCIKIGKQFFKKNK